MCEGETYLYEASTGPGPIYSWSVTNGVIIGNPDPWKVQVTWTTPPTGFIAVSVLSGSCTDETEVPIDIKAKPISPTSGGDITECKQDPIQTLTAIAFPPLGSTIVWYDAAVGGNIVAFPTLNVVGSITYYAESTQASPSCTSADRTPVTLTIENPPSTSLIFHN